MRIDILLCRASSGESGCPGSYWLHWRGYTVSRGLVFQALLRNPLAEPYILGVSGGSAVGAIIGILLGMSPYPGVALFVFAGSMATLLLVLLIASTRSAMKKDTLILAGVMVNAFCFLRYNVSHLNYPGFPAPQHSFLADGRSVDV